MCLHRPMVKKLLQTHLKLGMKEKHEIYIKGLKIIVYLCDIAFTNIAVMIINMLCSSNVCKFNGELV